MRRVRNAILLAASGLALAAAIAAQAQVKIGVITSVSQPFCGDCTRARLSSDGKLYTCLFAADGQDLRGPLRAGAGDDELADLIGGIWRRRADRYSELRSAATPRLPKVEMSRIGG